MPNLGPTELIIILVIVIIIFGAGKLPEIGGALGKGIKEFKAANDEAKGVKEDLKAATSLEPKKEESEQV